ncbi:hypothetical protein NP233_g10426 [Leucocoprinus birnbaumii]|uniref:Uncharacterized protein n=1 Tax=Leucocoprinus birnbaumii TaxID=56174 RepID=A0AAD5VM25_9AGAR|nr:hypothetical protein NP233_g10426 [Leucocoprinus birnbaumii]
MGAAGLFIYAATAARFINERDSLGPEHQLRTVLDHIRKNRATTESARTNPFARMDQLYMLIMQRVPPNVMPTLQRILLLNWAYIDPVYDNVLELANVLELSEAQFCTACGFLQSVLRLGNSSHHRLSAGMSIKFYHASFMEFMEDQEDSSSVLAKITFPPQSPLPDGHIDMLIYGSLLESLIQLCQLDKRALEPSVAASLLEINFSMIPRLMNGSPFPAIFVKHQQMRRNLPRQFRDRILRRAWNPLIYLHRPNYAAPERPFIIGNGSNGLLVKVIHPLLIWRLWILWHNGIIIVVPVILAIACVGIDLATVSRQAHVNFLASNYSFALGLGFFGLPPVTTILVTALTVSRLARMMNHEKRAGTAAGPYVRRFLRLLLESYSTNAVWSVGIIVTYAIQQPLIYTIFIQSSINIKVITMLLPLNRAYLDARYERSAPPRSIVLAQQSHQIASPIVEPRNPDLEDLSQPPRPSSPQKGLQVKDQVV